MLKTDQIRLSREELYDLVWQTPMTRLASQFGLSDVGLKKVCRKHDIPTPPLGYWAKRSFGKPVTQALLPPSESSKGVLLTVPSPRMDDAALRAAKAGAREHISAAPEIEVPATRPTKLHPIAATTWRALRKTRSGPDGVKSVKSAGAVVATVSNDSADRVCRIIHAFALAAEECGYSFSEVPDGVQILVDGTPVSWEIKETLDRRPHEPTKKELEAQARYEENRARWPSIYSLDSSQKVYRLWDQFPSGRLSMTLRDPSTYRWNRQDLIGHWRDRKTKPLEHYLNKALVALAVGASEIRYRQAEAAEKERLRLAEVERQRLERERRERAQKRRERYYEMAEKLEQHRKLKALSDYLEQHPEEPEASESKQFLDELQQITDDLMQEVSVRAIHHDFQARGVLDDEAS